MFLASAKAVKLAHEIDAGIKVGCMVQYPTTYAKTAAPQDQMAQRFQMMPNWYYTDVMAKGFYTNLCKAQLKRLNVNFEVSEEDAKQSTILPLVTISLLQPDAMIPVTVLSKEIIPIWKEMTGTGQLIQSA